MALRGITVMLMPPVPILSEVSIVHVTQDTLEMEQSVKVRLLLIYGTTYLCANYFRY